VGWCRGNDWHGQGASDASGGRSAVVPGRTV